MIIHAQKKPVIVEVMQFTGSKQNIIEILNWAHAGLPSIANVKIYEFCGLIIIKTLKGEMLCGILDYIIKCVNGEFYPVKKDIFEKTYDIVEN